MTEDAGQTSEKNTIARPAAFRVVHGVTKTIAIVVGLPLTLFSLMSLVGLATDNFWIRLVPAIVVALGGPLVLVDRLLPDDDQARARGMPTDVLALSWLGFSVLFAGLGQPVTGSMLVAEADRYYAGGSTELARVAYWIGGVTPVTPRTPAEVRTNRSNEDADAGPEGSDAAPNAGDDGGANAGDAGPGDDAATGDAASGDSPTKVAGDDAPAKTYTPAELFAKMSPATVTISVRNRYGEQGSGTGFFIDEDGTIATNQHVIRDAQSVSVKLIGEQYESGHRWIHEVELLVEDPEVDLALLRVPPQRGITPLPLGDSDRVEVGSQIICIGNPLGLEHTLSDGLVSARRVHRGRRWVQMTAPISPGNSGGPVISMDGRVIGIATATINRVFGNAQNLNLAVPVNVLKAMLRDDYPDRRRFEIGPGGPSTW